MSHPKFVSFTRNGHSGYGLLAGDGIIDLSARHGTKWPTLREVIADGVLLKLAEEAASLEPDFSRVGHPL